eukprot:12373789-Alexandrium_andersonii.AAC.1
MSPTRGFLCARRWGSSRRRRTGSTGPWRALQPPRSCAAACSRAATSSPPSTTTGRRPRGWRCARPSRRGTWSSSARWPSSW